MIRLFISYFSLFLVFSLVGWRATGADGFSGVACGIGRQLVTPMDFRLLQVIATFHAFIWCGTRLSGYEMVFTWPILLCGLFWCVLF